MPNRYVPAALSDMIAEKHDGLLVTVSDRDSDSDEYVAEYEALLEMLQPEYQEEFRRRTGELDG